MAERDRLLSDCRGECLDRGFESPPPRQVLKNLPQPAKVDSGTQEGMIFKSPPPRKICNKKPGDWPGLFFHRWSLSFHQHISTGNDIHASSKRIFQDYIAHLDRGFQLNPTNF